MARTKSITLAYKLTQTEIIPPSPKDVARKDEWIKTLQHEVEADYKPLIVKVRYEIFNPEIEQQRRFFEGACVEYYAIQNKDMVAGRPDPVMLKQYREEILDEMLGFDYKTVNKIIRTRESTADFKTVQAWHTFLQKLEETIFDSAGYEFPDSKKFWELAKAHGYDQARQIVIDQLQASMQKRV